MNLEEKIYNKLWLSGLFTSKKETKDYASDLAKIANEHKDEMAVVKRHKGCKFMTHDFCNKNIDDCYGCKLYEWNNLAD